MSGPLQVSWKDKLEFIASLLIPSFNPKNKLNTPEERDAWLQTRGEQKKWRMDILAELIERYGMVISLEEAEARLEKESMRGTLNF